MEYGTGAIMAVPTHDQRDFLFAQEHKLPMRLVIAPKEGGIKTEELTQAYEGEGVQVNSGEFNGLSNLEAKEKIAAWMEKKVIGKIQTHWRLRDWSICTLLFSGDIFEKKAIHTI